MTEETLKEILKIEADSKGIWLSAVADNVSVPAITAFLRSKGIRKYDEQAVEEFAKQKYRMPQKIAERSDADEKDAVIAVKISKDSLSASVSVEAPFFTKPWPDKAAIEEALAQKNVVFGIDQNAIEKLLDLKLSDEEVVVAQGTPPQNGKSARIEELIDPDQKPDIDMDAQKIDHRARSFFTNVLQGQEIAVKHPATPGEDGTSVLGTPIKAVPGKDVPFPIGGGLNVSEDGLLLTAAIDGRLHKKDKKLSVLPELEVKGDVDFSIGNIDFTGSVKILGAVREGFRVVAAGNIMIKEMVEGAHVESANDIVIIGGVRGMNRGRIIAGGKVVAGFVDQAYVRSRADIEIKNSVFHSDVAAQYNVTVMGGQKSQIAGGKIQAGVAVICQTLGSEMGTKTEVIVGVPPEQAERRKELQAMIAQHNENIEKLEASLGFLKKQDLAGALDDGKRSIMVTATKSKFQLQSTLKAMTEELKEIDERLELTKSRGIVRVKGVCYPGVIITLRGFAYLVREAVKYASFVFDDGEIRLRSFDG
ncbi:MAG: FapA family protein [Synergistaceae bacterium]|nr:FapA family protein [Synergistaceae bacterium]